MDAVENGTDDFQQLGIFFGIVRLDLRGQEGNQQTG
jgi:hypothetical protein